MTHGDPPSRRLIDRWFPVAAVDKACGTPEGSGRSEKALFTWFASRPIAQARAAALTALLPDDDTLKPLVERAILTGDRTSVDSLRDAVLEHHGGRRPLVLDPFSGRGILPLEAARAGASSRGVDLSPVAVLAGRLLADYPLRDWSEEPPLPIPGYADVDALSLEDRGARLADDVEAILAEVDRRVAERVGWLYPLNEFGQFPWGYLWAITIPCDKCRRPFPLLGSLLLKHPKAKNADVGQSLRIGVNRDAWFAEVIDGAPHQTPTYTSATTSTGQKRKGKAAHCVFCGHVHPLVTVKAKGEAGEYADTLIAVADRDSNGNRYFRAPTAPELEAIEAVEILDIPDLEGPYSTVPDERIPDGNVHTVMASGYGYRTFGELMVKRQTLSFAYTGLAIREVREILLRGGVSQPYADALASYAAANLCRRIRRSTRGARLMQHGRADGSTNNNTQVGDVFQNEASVNFQFDYFEAGPGEGAGTWSSVGKAGVNALRRILRGATGEPVRFLQASAGALPIRDGSVDLILTDPPYYDMVEYADASDIFHVWLKRVLFDIHPDLFGVEAQDRTGLQNKNDEIIVRRVHESGRVVHDKPFYEQALRQSFDEALRVLKPEGHMVLVFGHSDPDAWTRLLSALHAAGFIITSSWPSRTEAGSAGVASIKVTVTIGCGVAPAGRPVSTVAKAEVEVADVVEARAQSWDADELALEDQLMASYGPAMEVYGRYSSVLHTDGSAAEIERFLAVARRAVRDSMKLRVDELPIESFDSVTRFALFWLRAKGRGVVPKGEARFFAQADGLPLEQLRGSILEESGKGFRLSFAPIDRLDESTSVFEVVRAMAHAWHAGGASEVAEVLIKARRDPRDGHVWAVIADLSTNLPASDDTARALAAIQRNSNALGALVGSANRLDAQQLTFDVEKGES